MLPQTPYNEENACSYDILNIILSFPEEYIYIMCEKETTEKRRERSSVKTQNTIAFINAATELINELGLENISIRKIAQRAGFHNSTIYLYFKDLDELAMLASMKSFQEYSYALSLLNKTPCTPTDRYMKIWELFMNSALKLPNLYYNFFYGKRSDDLTATMNHYYELFPEEKQQFSDIIESMYFGRNIKERSLCILKSIIGEANRVTEENAAMINEIIDCCCKNTLLQKRQNMDADNDELRDRFLEKVIFITGIRQETKLQFTP